MKATATPSKVVKRRPIRLMSVVGNTVSILFICGLIYLWSRVDIPLYIKTSLLTIIGGALVVVAGQVVQKWYIEPVQDLQKTIGEVGSAVLVYSNTADSHINEDLQTEASQALRKLSGDLLGKRRVIAHYRFFERLGILPAQRNIREAAQGLILMSNSVGSHSFESFDKGRDLIKEALWLDDYPQ